MRAAAPLERHADGGELLGEPTDAHAEDHSPAGEVVERRQLLGEDHRVALRQDEDAGGEANAFGRRGDVGEPDQRVGDRRILAAGHPAVVGVGIRRPVPRRDDDVLHRPQRLEAVGFGSRGERRSGVRLDERAGVGEGDPELHERMLGGDPAGVGSGGDVSMLGGGAD